MVVHNKNQLKFTLVELLVVIAIISILASLLLPTLQSAIASSHDAACASMERQIGAATFLYSGDYDDYLVPGVNSVRASNAHIWEYFLGSLSGSYNGGCTSPYGLTLSYGVDKQYQTNIICPAEPAQSGWGAVYNGDHFRYTHYTAGHVLGERYELASPQVQAGRGFRRIGAVTQASYCVVAGDSLSRLSTRVVDYGRLYLSFRHGGGIDLRVNDSASAVNSDRPSAFIGVSNVLYVDGHVSALSMHELLDQSVTLAGKSASTAINDKANAWASYGYVATP